MIKRTTKTRHCEQNEVLRGNLRQKVFHTRHCEAKAQRSITHPSLRGSNGFAVVTWQSYAITYKAFSILSPMGEKFPRRQMPSYNDVYKRKKQMIMKEKTVYVFGAGSTATMGIPITNKQKELLCNLKTQKNENLQKLYSILNGSFGKDNYEISDVYNFIDNALGLQSGLYCKEEKIDGTEVLKCKRDLICFIFDEFIKKMRENREQKDIEYQKHVDFFYKLAKRELNAKADGIKQDGTNRDNFISDYSVINFNWDFYSIFAIKDAHERLNHENGIFLVGDRNPQLRMYTDFNCECATKVKDNKKLWYPFTEGMAQIVNDGKKYDTTRRVVLTKVYYPHGLMNLFKCPKCARHSIYFDDFHINSIINKLHYSEEKTLYTCPYCGAEVSEKDFDVLIQSNFKTRNAYLEENRIRMYNELEDAENLVFIGYSMPPDDVDYKTFFKSLYKLKNVYVVLYDKNNPHEFKKADLNSVGNGTTIERFREVFKGKNIDLYYNTQGFPNAADAILEIIK